MPGELAGITDEAAHDLPGQLTVLGSLGWSAIELRSVDRQPIAELSDRRFDEVAKSLSDKGIQAVCLASRIGNWARPITHPFGHDLAELDVLGRRCADLGTRFVRIMSFPNDGYDDETWRARVRGRILRLTEHAEKLGVVLLLENCAGWAGASAARMLELLGWADSPALKLLFDTGNGVAHGYGGYEMLREIAPHVAHVHVKDSVGSRFVVPGEGEARVADCVRLLRANGYDGAWSLEPHLGLVPHEPGELADDAAELFVTAGHAMAGLVR